MYRYHVLFVSMNIYGIDCKKKQSPPMANLQGLSEPRSLTTPSLTVPATTIAHVQAIVRYRQDNLAAG
jgi:hypothetical protein